jgi:glycine cleavage system H protein
MDIRYTAEHEWVTVEGNQATVGITDHAQSALGDLVFVQLPTVGAALGRGEVAAVVESVKAASDVLAPLSGSIVAVNQATVAEPALLNSDPMGAGWLFKIDMSQPEEISQLLDAAAYGRITS